MTDRAALTELLEMVEAGTWPADFLAVDNDLHGITTATMYAAFNGSLDAAKALHESVLPGCKWGIHEPKPGVFRAYVSEWSPFRPIPTTCEADSPARAWLNAIIRAKISKEQKQ